MNILNSSRVQLIYDAYHSSGGFYNGAYLNRFGRESDDDYEERQGIAWYDNMLKPACTRYAGYLARNSATRATDDARLQAMLNNVDMAGTSAEAWWLRAAKSFKPYGTGLVVVEMPEGAPGSTQQDQVAARFLPYFSLVQLNDVTDYAIDEFGEITMLKIRSVERVGSKYVTAQRYWDQERWVASVSGEVISEGEITFGKCPVVPFSEDDFGEMGEYAGIAEIAKRLYNLNSEADQLVRDQTFAIMHYQVPPDQASIIADSEIAQSIGTHNLIKYFGDNPPGFSSPDPSSLEKIRERALDLKKRIDEITHTTESTSVPESGVARAIKFQELNSSLSGYATQMEATERKAWDIACLRLGINPEAISVQWPKEYNISDVQEEFDNLDRAVASGLPPAAIDEFKRKVISVALTSLEPETEAEIMGQLDESSLSSA